MKHTWLISVAVFALAAGNACAAPSAVTTPSSASPMTSPASGDAAAPGGTAGEHHHWTLAEARKHAHDYAEKLDKMTEKEWEEKEARRDAFFKKLHDMTPEQKAAWKEQQHEKRMQKMQQQGSSASPADSRGSAPSASPASASPSAGDNH